MPRQDRAWVGYLTASEQGALAASEDFFVRPDSRARRWLSRVNRPFEALLQVAPSSVQTSVEQILHGLLMSVATGAEVGRYERDLIDRLCERSGRELEPWQRIFTLELSLLESLAQETLGKAKGLALCQGGVTGMAGAPGLLADLPTFYFLLFRTVRQVATCFGFPAQSDQERLYLLKVVHAGHHLEWRERRCALLDLDALRTLKTPLTSSEDVQRALLAKTVQQMAARLAAQLMTRKAAQTVAVVGGAVGAVLNRQLLDDVGQTSFHAYRRRFLQAVAQMRASGSLPV